MKTFTKKCCVILSALMISPLTQADDKVPIYAIQIPGLHQLDGQGSYDKIIQDILIDTNLATIEVLPTARAIHYFDNCESCCYTPISDNPEFGEPDFEVIASDPMYIAQIFVFGHPDRPSLHNIQSVEKLQGLKIGHRHGMGFGKSFTNAELNTIETLTDESNIQKVLSDRIDVMIAYAPDVFHAFEKLGIEPFPHDKSKPFLEHNDSLVCRGVDPSFIETFNQGLADLDLVDP